MPQWLSRTIVVLLALPLGCLTAWFLFLWLMVGWGLIEDPSAQGALLMLVYVLTLAAVLAGWVLVARFVRVGIVGLCNTDRRVWWVASAGVPLALVALIGFRFEQLFELRFTSELAWGMQFLQFGVLFVVTFMYLVLERTIRGRKLTTRWSGP